ncbi:hypothetical protein D1007_57835 [Hordeum vulgare]|nr:hypothetical protein D1007_57835 [Hordeum vulgare]
MGLPAGDPSIPGFGQRWREWISILISSTSTKVLINGNPGPPVIHECGHRQGDPVSHMLFVLVNDALNFVFQKAIKAGVLHHVTPRHDASSIFLFVNDVVIFSHTDLDHLVAIQVTLNTFGTTSGLRTNSSKCSATLIQCLNALVEAFGEALNRLVRQALHYQLPRHAAIQEEGALLRTHVIGGRTDQWTLHLTRLAAISWGAIGASPPRSE